MNDYWPKSLRTTVKKLRLFTAGICLSAALIGSPSVQGISITFEANNITDVDAGEDLWQFSYTVSGGGFAFDEGFSIYFDYLSYKSLAAVSSPGGWVIDVFQRDIGLASDGYYDALNALGDLSDPFVLNVVWLGTGTPGPQPFELYTQDGGFAVLDDGETVLDTQGGTDGGSDGGTDGSNNVPDAGSSLLFSLLAIGSLVGSRKIFGALRK